MIESTPPSVIVLPFDAEHKEVFSRVSNRVVTQQELLRAGVLYWLWNIRPNQLNRPITTDETDVWDTVHEAIWGLPEWQHGLLADLHALPLAEAINTECDELSNEVMQIGEDLSSTLSSMGAAAEVITHVCFVYCDDCALYLHCHIDETRYFRE